MKLGMVVTTPESRFAAVAMRGGLAESFSRVKGLGYDGVELSFREPKAVDSQALRVSSSFAIRSAA